MESADIKARSPWSTLNGVNEVEISPANMRIDKEITIPGSKSFTNRALIMAALADGSSTISGILRSDDSYWCIEALKKLGIHITVENDTVHIQGCNGNWPVKKEELYIGAAGTIARFLPGALAAANDGDWRVDASKRMSQRPVSPLIDALTDLGANINYLGSENFYPLSVEASGLSGGDVSISGKVSSQFISGLLIASPYAKNAVHINVTDHIVQHAYVKITLDLMKRFGAEMNYDEDLQHMSVKPVHYSGQDLPLEADASTTCYFLALAALTNGRIRINNLSDSTNQPDIKMVDLFERMGCKVNKGEGFIELQGTEQLKGGFEMSMKEMSDQALTLAAIAPFADGPIKITDVAHIRHHESDRIKVIFESLSRLGIKVEEYHDGVTVYPGTPESSSVLHSYDDHRVAMSLALIGTKIPGIKITDPGCISKTCPTYFELLQQLGVQLKFS